MGYEKYQGGTQVISGLIQENNRGFPILRACDIVMPDNSRLDEYLDNFEVGGTGLPDYTDADNGKFLQLVDGSPSWVLIEDGNGVRY